MDQTHKFLVTQASFPNEDSFNGDTNFCYTLKKLMRSCKGDRKQVLDIKYPLLCSTVNEVTEGFDPKTVDCETIATAQVQNANHLIDSIGHVLTNHNRVN